MSMTSISTSDGPNQFYWSPTVNMRHGSWLAPWTELLTTLVALEQLRTPRALARAGIESPKVVSWQAMSDFRVLISLHNLKICDP